MKKVYLQPSIYLHTLKIEADVLVGTPTYTGSASEEHSGEGTTEGSVLDKEETPNIGGTGSDNDFILGSPIHKRTY